MAFNEEFEVRIPSDTAEGQAVQERIIALLEKQQFSARDVFGVRLSLEEALVNAIKHGNGMDPEKQVYVGCWVDDEKARIEIEDQGPGFAVTDVPDPTADENLDKPCGRGIMLMRAFMSRLEYNETGNRLLMERLKNQPDNDDD
ncbi:MAG: ATP-binding protein [Planctomycetota bacterium]|nr:ATP-binding protein [Planctomycetota bacterium]